MMVLVTTWDCAIVSNVIAEVYSMLVSVGMTDDSNPCAVVPSGPSVICIARVCGGIMIVAVQVHVCNRCGVKRGVRHGGGWRPWRRGGGGDSWWRGVAAAFGGAADMSTIIRSAFSCFHEVGNN